MLNIVKKDYAELALDGSNYHNVYMFIWSTLCIAVCLLFTQQ